MSNCMTLRLLRMRTNSVDADTGVSLPDVCIVLVRLHRLEVVIIADLPLGCHGNGFGLDEAPRHIVIVGQVIVIVFMRLFHFNGGVVLLPRVTGMAMGWLEVVREFRNMDVPEIIIRMLMVVVFVFLLPIPAVYLLSIIVLHTVHIPVLHVN